MSVDLERVRAGLDRLFGTVGGCHDLEDAQWIVDLVAREELDVQFLEDRVEYLEGVLRDVSVAVQRAL